MRSTDHRKGSMHGRNGRTRYEKGRTQHHSGGKARPLKRAKGDRRHTQHNPEPLVVTLGDIIE